MNESHQNTIREMRTKLTVEKQEIYQIIELKQEMIDDIKYWLEHESEKLEEKRLLEADIDALDSKHKNDIATIKKERAQAIDKLRKEMLMNIRNVKIQMLSMNEDQLQGTTKLTVKQNIQLSSELEYQSQHIEQLIYQNTKMKQQMKILKIELEEHAEVENELAKRSHFCNRVI
jgi:hypothetical protein